MRSHSSESAGRKLSIACVYLHRIVLREGKRKIDGEREQERKREIGREEGEKKTGREEESNHLEDYQFTVGNSY